MNKHNLKVGQVLGDYRVVSVGEEGAFLTDAKNQISALWWYTNDEIQDKFNLPKEKWVPSEGEKYFWLNSCLGIENYINNSTYDSTYDEKRIRIGNCFKTESEALVKAEEIKKVLMK